MILAQMNEAFKGKSGILTLKYHAASIEADEKRAKKMESLKLN
jgi:hypothetical protein